MSLCLRRRVRSLTLCTPLHWIMVGPGGTGKTAVLTATEAMIAFFVGPEKVQKLAPSNAAARLLGGDTIHALCKLPFGHAALSSKKGRLTSDKLQALRRKWSNSVAAFLDEVSMIAADQFLQCDVRMRQAKMRSDLFCGGLALNICGDFLQLPPVDKDGSRPSLAMDLDAPEPPPEEGGEQKRLAGQHIVEAWQRVGRAVLIGCPCGEW